MRRRLALAAGWIGGVLAVSAIAIVGVGAVDTLRPVSAEGLAPAADDTAVAAPTPTASTSPEPSVVETSPAGSGTPGVTADEYGTLFYTGDADPASISYPDTMSAEERANAEIWMAQQYIVAECMSDAGFDYSWTLWWQRDKRTPWGALYPAGSPADLALYGNAGTGLDYRWEDAGCHGRAVHETGQDNAN